MRKNVIAGRALEIDCLYVYSVLAFEIGAELSGAVACLVPFFNELMRLSFLSCLNLNQRVKKEGKGGF